jgi:geranylgeranyl diphosphate synthase type I
VELLHNFSLLHDDLMDRDQVRRHRPTAWTVFGVAEAILAGDALIGLATRCLATAGPNPGTAVDWLGQAVVDMCHGQAEDIAFGGRDDVEVSECMAMASRKTGALLGVSCALGALAGGADDETAQLLRKFGNHIGTAYQLVDDLLGIWGDPRRTGKPAFSDLINRKRSLPVVAALRSDTLHGCQLAALYAGTEPLRESERAQAADLIAGAGAREWSQSQAAAAIQRAQEYLDAASVDRGSAEALREVARLMISRDH